MRPSLPLSKGHQSSRQWLARQFRDPYVQRRMASPANYRSRSAFKLIEMESIYHFIERRRSQPPPRVIVDLGAAPGGWSQVVALKSGFSSYMHFPSAEPADMQYYGLSEAAKMKRRGAWSDHFNIESESHDVEDPPKIIAVDLLRMQPIPGVSIIQADFLSPTATELIRGHFPKGVPDTGVDLLLCDMAANATGNPAADVANSLRICEAIATFAEKHLTPKRKDNPGGSLVLKHFVHPETQEFYKNYLMRSFRKVWHTKPPSSRSESSERYWVCQGWFGGPSQRLQQEMPPPPRVALDPFQRKL